MPHNKKYVVWSWVDENGDTRFVGWGCWGQQHPARKMWLRRMDANSDVNFWLRTFEFEPKRFDHNGIIRYYKYEACTVAVALRDRHKGTILDSRPWGSRAGGGAGRMVVAPDFRIFTSVRQAAVEEGVNPCTITRWCQMDGSGWDYIN